MGHTPSKNIYSRSSNEAPQHAAEERHGPRLLQHLKVRVVVAGVTVAISTPLALNHHHGALGLGGHDLGLIVHHAAILRRGL